MSENNQRTQRSLLLRLRDVRNAEAWEQFVALASISL